MNDDLAVLEPAGAPAFAKSVLGYRPEQVDAFVDDQRRRLAAMRARAMQAERRLAALEPDGQDRPRLGAAPDGAPLVAPTPPARPAWTGKVARYAATSVLSIVLTEAILTVVYGQLRLSSAGVCSVLASSLAAVPHLLRLPALGVAPVGRSGWAVRCCPSG